MINKIKIFAVVITVIFMFSACTVQEKMNPMIFTERITKLMNEEISIGESFSKNGRYIIFFSDKSGNNYICELLTDNSENIKKVCLASNNTSKAESFKYLFERIIMIYAPSENSAEIISNLFNKKWNYHTTQWYSYSGIISDEGLFASIENKMLSTQSDAELTLKQSDIIRP